MKRRRLTNEQIESLYDALLANADALCRDAELLMDAGSLGRAQALVILALEESAKAIAIHERRATAARHALPTPDLDADFWKEWSAHLPKLRRVREFLINEDYWFAEGPPDPHELLAGPPEEYLKTLDRWAAEDHQAKLRGFYVDVDWATGGVVYLSTSAEDIRAMIELVEQVGWQVRQGDHIVWRMFQETLDEMGADSPFSATAVTGMQQLQRMHNAGWEAYRRALLRMSTQLDADESSSAARDATTGWTSVDG